MCGIGLHMEQSGMFWIVGGVLKGGPAEKTSIQVVIIDDNQSHIPCGGGLRYIVHDAREDIIPLSNCF
jgi:hypothetical protein